MRARRSSIPLPKRRPSLLALRSAARPHLDPRTRSRRRAAVFGCGGTASQRRGVIELLEGRRGVRRAGAAMASQALRRGRPRAAAAVTKAGRGLSRLAAPSLKARAPGRSPALRGRPGRAPAVLRNLSGPLGVSRDEGTSTATRTFALLGMPSVLQPLAFARGRGIPGARGARDSSSGGLAFACGRAAMLRTDRAASAFGRGEGSLNDNYNDPP